MSGNNLLNKAQKARKKVRISIYLQPEIVEHFQAKAAIAGLGYQPLINQALLETIKSDSAPLTTQLLRQILMEEFSKYFANQN